MRRTFLLPCLCAFLLAPVAHTAPIPAVEFSSANTYNINAGGQQAVGFKFTTVSPISIGALGVFGPDANGTPVRLYNGGGTVLASATVTPADPSGGSPFSFKFASISPVDLPAGQTFYIVADLEPGQSFYGNAVGLTTDPAITYGGILSGGIGTKPTTDSFGYGGFAGIAAFGPNFEIRAVPEPSSLALLGFLLVAGVTGYRRRALRA